MPAPSLFTSRAKPGPLRGDKKRRNDESDRRSNDSRNHNEPDLVSNAFEDMGKVYRVKFLTFRFLLVYFHCHFPLSFQASRIDRIA